MTIHDKIAEQTELAKTYAIDGAFFSAARVLRDLAALVGEHAKACSPDYRPTRHIDAGPDAYGERKPR